MSGRLSILSFSSLSWKVLNLHAYTHTHTHTMLLFVICMQEATVGVYIYICIWYTVRKLRLSYQNFKNSSIKFFFISGMAAQVSFSNWSISHEYMSSQQLYFTLLLFVSFFEQCMLGENWKENAIGKFYKWVSIVSIFSAVFKALVNINAHVLTLLKIFLSSIHLTKNWQSKLPDICVKISPCTGWLIHMRSI